jgi:hypothetical protein
MAHAGVLTQKPAACSRRSCYGTILAGVAAVVIAFALVPLLDRIGHEKADAATATPSYVPQRVIAGALGSLETHDARLAVIGSGASTKVPCGFRPAGVAGALR